MYRFGKLADGIGAGGVVCENHVTDQYDVVVVVWIYNITLL